jgi:TonB family protein
VGLIVCFALSAWPATAQDIMTRAKNLYQTADYDQALALLDQLKDDPVAEAMPDVAAYRVFCLLALGRTVEAQAGIAGILRRDPGYQPSETEASPRIRAVFQDVRRRLLPEVFQERYSAAKATFERKDYRSAVDQFKMLLLLVDDPAVAGEDSRRDLRMLISGFADIAQAAVNTQALAPTTASAPAASTPPARGASNQSQPTVSVAAMRLPAGPSQIYTAVDAGVIPPVAVIKTVPSFRPGGADVTREFTGVVEVLVNEKGNVAEAKIQKSVYPIYDPRLIAAAHQWKFRPALKDGQPVSYRTYIEVKLVP